MDTIEFKDPVEMLLFIDDSLLSGSVQLYRWQVNILRDFAKESTAEAPFQATLCAANGSGKDRFIIAPAGIWLLGKYKKASAIFTTASGTQLDAQLGLYLANLASSYNRVLGTEFWKINYRRIESPVTESVARFFATDEPGKAEGFHPIIAGGQFAIFVSEAKSIPDDIFKALARCTGYTKRLDVSSPGAPEGFFYQCHNSEFWKHYHVTAFDCPHLSREYIRQIAELYGGESSELYRSMVLAEFVSSDEPIVLRLTDVKKVVNSRIPHFQESDNSAGFDLSAGGDETVIVVRNGNKVLGIECCRFSDTTKIDDWADSVFKSYNLDSTGAVINADSGGLGKPILDRLRKRGWKNIRYIFNQSKPTDAKAYHNRGTELWFRFKQLVQNYEVILPNDEKLLRQLSTRYYSFKDQKLILESKVQARAKGRPSPDRADALVLAFANYNFTHRGICDEVKLRRTTNPVEPTPPLTITRYVKEGRKSYTRVSPLLLQELEMINANAR